MENPYWLSLVEPRPEYLKTIAGWALGFGGVFVTVDLIVSRGASTSKGTNNALKAVSSPRPGTAAGDGRPKRSGLSAATTICSTLHALVTSVNAVRSCLMLTAGDTALDDAAVKLWQSTLAFSQGYFVADALLYGTRRETWNLLHHGWMILAHHPIGEPLKGCMLMGCGDCRRAIWLSATGYGAEISTLFLNIRKFQIWLLRKHSIWYTVNSALLLITYPITRVVASGAILWFSLWPHMPEYQRQGLGGLVTFTTVTYSALTLMSAYFYCTLLSKGIGRALVLKSSADKEKL